MSKLELRELTIEDESAFTKGYEDWRNEDITWYSFIWNPGSDYKEHLNQLEELKDKSKLAENRVPSSMLYAFVNGEIVGRLSIRHELNASLLERGGHIGYAVSPRHRKNGYATEIFRQGLIYCSNLGLKNILVTCGDQNIPSWKIIEKFASNLENRIFDSSKNEYVRRYWVDVQKSLSNNFIINKKWEEYFKKNANRKPRPFFIKACEFINQSKEMKVLDLGCGVGVESIELLKMGHIVTAVDNQISAQSYLISQLPIELASNFNFILSDFETLKLNEKFDFIYAYHSLPFCKKHHFDKVVDDTLSLLNNNGIFAGSFFGDKDEWALADHVTGISKQRIDKIFENYEILYIEETLENSRTSLGGIKDWHFFDIIARKR